MFVKTVDELIDSVKTRGSLSSDGEQLYHDEDSIFKKIYHQLESVYDFALIRRKSIYEKFIFISPLEAKNGYTLPVDTINSCERVSSKYPFSFGENLEQVYSSSSVNKRNCFYLQSGKIYANVADSSSYIRISVYIEPFSIVRNNNSIQVSFESKIDGNISEKKYQYIYTFDSSVLNSGSHIANEIINYNQKITNKETVSSFILQDRDNPFIISFGEKDFFSVNIPVAIDGTYSGLGRISLFLASINEELENNKLLTLKPSTLYLPSHNGYTRGVAIPMLPNGYSEYLVLKVLESMELGDDQAASIRNDLRVKKDYLNKQDASEARDSSPFIQKNNFMVDELDV